MYRRIGLDRALNSLPGRKDDFSSLIFDREIEAFLLMMHISLGIVIS